MTPEEVHANCERLRKTVTNLLSNAITEAEVTYAEQVANGTTGCTRQHSFQDWCNLWRPGLTNVINLILDGKDVLHGGAGDDVTERLNRIDALTNQHEEFTPSPVPGTLREWVEGNENETDE
jgi:hypothetical protein